MKKEIKNFISELTLMFLIIGLLWLSLLCGCHASFEPAESSDQIKKYPLTCRYCLSEYKLYYGNGRDQKDFSGLSDCNSACLRSIREEECKKLFYEDEPIKNFNDEKYIKYVECQKK